MKTLQFDFRLCGECGGCVAVCPAGALELYSDGLHLKHELCTLCENCMIFCPTGALQIESGVSKTSFSSPKKLTHSENGREV